MKKKMTNGGGISSLLPLLDLAAPGLGTAASTVAGVLEQANAFNKQTTPLNKPTNPFRTFKNGGELDPGKPKKKINLGDIEFYEEDVRPTKKVYSIVKDLKTGKDYGVVKTPEGSWRYKNSNSDNLHISKMQTDYDSYKGTGKAGQNTIIDNGNSIRLTKGKDKGVDIPTALLDSVIVASKRQNTDPSVLLGLISRESAFGKSNENRTDKRLSTNKLELISAHSLIPSTRPLPPEMYLANRGIKGVKVDKGKKGWKAYIDSSSELEKNLNNDLVKNYSDYISKFVPSKSTNAFDWGIQMLKEGFQSYNPGDPRYSSMLQKDINAMKTDKSVQDYIRKRTPELKFGGNLKQYAVPTHEQGGQLVDKMGNPTNNPEFEIEKQESIYTDKKGNTPFVMSDTLVDSDGKTFAMKAKQIESKYGKAKDQIGKSTYKKLMDELVTKNTIAKQMQDQISGTNAQKMPNGGLLDNNELDALINQRRLENSQGSLMTNLQSGAFPRIPRVDQIPSGSMRILDNARANPLVSQTAKLDTSKPVTPTTQSTGLGSLDLGKVGGILKGAALVGSAIDAFQKPEEEQLRVPDFSKGDKAYTGLGGSFDPIRNDIVQQAKSGENQIMQSSGNFGQVMSRLNALQAGVGRNLANVGLQEKQYNDQIRMSKGQREDQKAGIVASEQIRKQTADSQNKAMRQDLIANLLQNVNNYGTEFMKQDAFSKELKAMDKESQRNFLMQLSLLNIKNPNFQIDKNLINSDDPMSALKFVN